MASKNTNVPKYIIGTHYNEWKNKFTMWRLVTTVPKRKQGIIVLLETLDGNIKASKTVSDLTGDDLYTESI